MKIGRQVRVLTDSNRKELLNDTDEKRKLIISIFYPTSEPFNLDKQGLYIDLFYPCQEEFIRRYAGKKNLRGLEVNEAYLKSIKIDTYNNAPIIETNTIYPVIIYSPGLGMDRDSSIYIIERLVSEGYIVFTLGHLYDTNFTILPNGEVIEQAKFIADSTVEEKEQLINIRKEDILFFLDELKVLNVEDDFLKKKLDLNKIGIMGHSLGGAAIFKAAEKDSRIKAIVMLDGSLQYFNLTQDILEGITLSIPFLNFRRGSIDYSLEMQKTIEFNEGRLKGEDFKKIIIARHKTLMGQIKGQRELYEYLTGFKSFIKLNNSEHLTFTDWPTIYNQELENDVLPIKYAHEVISDTVIKFYNEFLCGKKDDYTNFINSNNCPQITKINKNGEQLS